LEQVFYEFDTSFRFGAFSSGTPDYAPVELNSLLFKAEKDLSWMCEQLNLLPEAKEWKPKADHRRKLINRYLWNETAGLYFDYHFFVKKQSDYIYATTFYPLWAGIATPHQAKKIVAKLKLFEAPGGVITSPYTTGTQWDSPYCWAPI